MNVITKNNHQLQDKNFRKLIRLEWLSKAFLTACLPNEVLSHLNMPTLQLQDGQFITFHSNRSLITDYVCRIDFKHMEGYALILIEHQSSSDRIMAARILQYSAEIIRQHSLQDSCDPLCPLVIPLVFYTGQSPFSSSCNLHDISFGEKIFDINPIHAQFQLVTPKDLDCIGVEHAFALSLFAKSFTLAHHPEVNALFEMMKQLERLKEEKYIEFKVALEDYLYKKVQCKLSDKDCATLESLYILTKGENKMPTLSYYLEKIGEKRGMQNGLREGEKRGMLKGQQIGEERGMLKGQELGEEKGLVKGKQEGKKNAQQQIAQEMIDDGMDIDLICRYTALTPDVINQLTNTALRMT